MVDPEVSRLETELSLERARSEVFQEELSRTYEQLQNANKMLANMGRLVPDPRSGMSNPFDTCPCNWCVNFRKERAALKAKG